MSRTIAVLLAALLALVCTISVADSPVWIDVRSESEYSADHIDGDANIPADAIAARIATLVPDKQAEVHLYCQKGGRAGKAKAILESLGYTHVTNAGGIADARRERGLGD